MGKTKGLKLRKIRVDGYKNLVDCTVEFDNLTILVGPNNSGKTNFLEILPLLGVLFYGQEAYGPFLDDDTSQRLEPFFCNLPKYKRKDLQVEIHFQCPIGKTTWDMCYKLVIARDAGKKNEDRKRFRFKQETIEGKPPRRRGPSSVLLKRKEDTLTVAANQGNKKHQIGINVSAFEFLRATLPNWSSLKTELVGALACIMDILASNILALSPESLRRQMNGELPLIPWKRNTTFSIPSLIDDIAKNTETYNLFKDTLCDIMDFDDVFFEAKDIYAPSAEHGEEFVKRVHTFAIKEKGTAFQSIERFSDGTLVVTGILAALLSESRDGAMLCIEELENCLHPAALEKLLGFLQDNADRWPVLITTHSPYLLNGVNPENVNVAVIDDKTGAVHCEKIKNNRELREYLNKGLMSFGDLLASNYDRFRE